MLERLWRPLLIRTDRVGMTSALDNQRPTSPRRRTWRRRSGEASKRRERECCLAPGPCVPSHRCAAHRSARPPSTRHRLLAQRSRGIEQTVRLRTVKDLRVRVVAVSQPGEVLTTLSVAGYLLPENGNNA